MKSNMDINRNEGRNFIVFPQWVKEKLAMALDTVTACSANMWNPEGSISLRALIFFFFNIKKLLQQQPGE